MKLAKDYYKIVDFFSNGKFFKVGLFLTQTLGTVQIFKAFKIFGHICHRYLVILLEISQTNDNL